MIIMMSPYKMLKGEDEILTDEFRSKHIGSSTPGAKMVPRRLTQCVKVTVIVLALTLVILIITAFTKGNGFQVFNVFNFKPMSNLQDTYHIGHMTFHKNTHSMIFKQTVSSIKEYLHIKIRSESERKLRSATLKPYASCIKTSGDNKKQVLCLEFDDLNSAVYEENVNGVDCHVVHWASQNMNLTTTVDQCFDMKEHWYGGGAISVQRWPLNRVDVPLQPYITRKFSHGSLNTSVHFDSFIEPYFVSASGVGLIFDSFQPLFISINDNDDKKICFKSRFDKPYHFENSLTHQTLLKFKICKDSTARDLHQHLHSTKELKHPLSTPNIDIMMKPLWSTRGVDIRNINQNTLYKYIDNLKHSTLSFSQLFIDGNYSRSPGSMYFDEKRFPNSAQLIMLLDSNQERRKLKVGTEVFPSLPKFMSSKGYSYPITERLNHNADNGAILLDLSNAKAVDWFTSQLTTIKNEVKVNGFRFSGGDAFSTLESVGAVTKHGTKRFLHPNEITHEYSRIASKFKDNSFLGSGYKSQIFGLVADAGPFLARWDHQKGLRGIIPTVNTYGIMGYPFVSVGPIGGIDYHLNSTSGQFSYSDRNLYIRWFQLSCFFPIMEFSIGPWQYDAQVLNYTKTLLNYRLNYLWLKHLYPAISEVPETGNPVIRPLWWIAPLDSTAQYIDCEFMVGNSLLVAPVLMPSHNARQIYLPEGSSWKDMLRGGEKLNGGQWLRFYHVGEFEIAHFVRVPSPTVKGRSL